MKVYKRNVLIYDNIIDYRWCVSWLENNLQDFHCVIPESKDNILKLILIDKLSITEFEKKLFDCVRSIYRTSSNRTVKYWTIRGWSEEEAKSKISKLQRKQSKRCIEYWLAKGFSEDEAKKELSLYQKNNGNYAIKKLNIDFWVDLGHTQEEAELLTIEQKKKFASCTVESFMQKGYSESEALSKIKLNSGKGSTLDYWVDKLGVVAGSIKYKELINTKRHFGEKNGQFGKSSPKGSGRGISGYYKSFYFRSLYEYSVLKYLENNNIEFICNDVSSATHPTKKIVIPYTIDGIVRNYIPDFIINKTTILEVKSLYFSNENEAKLKHAAAIQYIKENNIYTKFEVITDINIDKKELLNDYYNNVVIIDSGKLNRFKKSLNIRG